MYIPVWLVVDLVLDVMMLSQGSNFGEVSIVVKFPLDEGLPSLSSEGPSKGMGEQYIICSYNI